MLGDSPENLSCFSARKMRLVQPQSAAGCCASLMTPWSTQMHVNLDLRGGDEIHWNRFAPHGHTPSLRCPSSVRFRCAHGQHSFSERSRARDARDRKKRPDIHRPKASSWQRLGHQRKRANTQSPASTTWWYGLRFLCRRHPGGFDTGRGFGRRARATEHGLGDPRRIKIHWH